MVFSEGLLTDGDNLLEQRNSLFNLAVGFVGSCEIVLRAKPGGVVLGESLLTDGDNLLEQRDSLFNLAVGFVGYYKRVLRVKPGGVVFGEMTIPLLASLF